MTLNVGDVAGRMRAVEGAVQKGSRATVAAAALKAKGVILSGSPGRLSGVGKSGAKLGARFTIGGSDVSPSASVRATGPWQLVEEDTSPHVIRSKKRKRTKGRGRGGVAIPGVGVRASVHHPGTRGKHPWAKGVDKAAPFVAAEMRKQMANIAAAAFRG